MTNMEKITVFEAFAGYGSQSMALERLKQDIGLDYTVVGISEIDTNAVKAYYAARDAELLMRCCLDDNATENRGGGTNLRANSSTVFQTLETSAKSTGRMCRTSICSHTAFPAPTSVQPVCRKDLQRGLEQGHRCCGSVQELSKSSVRNIF